MNESTGSKIIASEALTQLEPEPTSRTATLQERFAAFLTDSLIFLHLLGGWALLLTDLTKGDLTEPLSFNLSGWAFFGSTGGAFYFLYYLLFEGVLLATPGKMLGGLAIQKKGHGTPSILSILIRNFFRLIDYPFFFITGIGMMEATRFHQRLGDWVAGTVVIRKFPSEGRRISTDLGSLAGATRRSIAFLLDLMLIVPFFYGLLLLIPTNRALVSLVTLSLVPTLTLAYLALSETFFQTTFGKALLGLKVVQEDGRPARFSSQLVRNVLRLFDANPLGYLCATVSNRKQRPGDIAAGTLVVKDRWGLRGWMAIPYMVVLSIGVSFLGYHNPHSFLQKGSRIEVGRYHFSPLPMELQRLTFKELHLESVELGFSEEKVNEKALYDAGNLVYLLLTVSGFEARNGRAWIQSDLQVRDPLNNLILDQPNIIDSSMPVGPQKSARLATRFALHPEATPGRYQVLVFVRDLFGKTQQQQETHFTVR